MKIGMIVLAGGVGKRIGRPFPKQFLLLGGKPLIIHVLEKARLIPAIERVVVTCPESHLDETRTLIDNHGFDAARFSCIVGGGRARSRSTGGSRPSMTPTRSSSTKPSVPSSPPTSSAS